MFIKGLNLPRRKKICCFWYKKSDELCNEKLNFFEQKKKCLKSNQKKHFICNKNHIVNSQFKLEYVTMLYYYLYPLSLFSINKIAFYVKVGV